MQSWAVPGQYLGMSSSAVRLTTDGIRLSGKCVRVPSKQLLWARRPQILACIPGPDSHGAVIVGVIIVVIVVVIDETIIAVVVETTAT